MPVVKSLFTSMLKNLNIIVAIVAMTIVIGLIQSNNAQKLSIEKLTTQVEQSNRIAAERLEQLNRMESTLNNQREISRKYLSLVEQEKEQSNADIQAIKQSLQSNECSHVSLPSSVIERLRNSSTNH